MTRIIMRILYAGLIIVAATNFSGCSTFRDGLVGEEHENLLPFAEQTVASLNVERIDFKDSEFAYLRAIADTEVAEIEALKKSLSIADEFRGEIIYYSVELVRIAEVNQTEEQKVQEFADALGAMRQQFSGMLVAEDKDFQAVERNIRNQADLLSALRLVQPLIDQAAERFEDLLREIEERTLVDAVKYLDSAIESHYALFLDYNEVLVQRRDDLLMGLSLIHQSRLGNDTAINELRDLNIVQDRDLSIPVSPTGRELDKLETFFLQQMERDTVVVAYLQADVDGYLTAHEELNREEAEVLDGLNVARLQIVAWSRAHQAMAHGAKEPGKWLKVAMDAAAASRSVR